MAGENETIDTNSTDQANSPAQVLDQFRKPDSAPLINTSDVSNYNYGLTPEQEASYNAQQAQYDPATGPLSVDTYYPGINHHIAVGNYSGSEIGSATLFAPGGALVPIGMMDARDAAVKRAALQRAKDIDDWKRKNSVAPTSKLTNINDNIRQEFFKHQDDSWNKALRATGGDGNKAKFLLENDPEYQAKNKSFYDQAKMGDAVVAQDAQLEDDVRSGKKVMTPAMIEARKKLHAATNPGSDEFKNFANAYNSYVAVDEFNNAYNTVVDKLSKEKLAQAGINESDPEYWTEFKKTKEYYREDQKQSVEDALNQMYKGKGDDFYTPDFIHKQVHGRLAGVREEKDVNLKAKPEDKDGVEEIDPKNISDEKGSLLGKVARVSVDKNGKPVANTNPREGTFSQFDGLTLRKPVDVVIPASADVTDMTTGHRSHATNVSKAKIGGIYNGYTLNGQLVDDDIIKNKDKHPDLKVTPMVSVIYTTKDKKGKEVETTGHMPLKQVENALLGKNNKNAKVLDEYYKRAEQRTSELKNGSAETTQSFDAKKSIHPLPKGKPRSVSQNGYTYTWNETTGQYE